jgi:DNA-binding MarR family transcriptional regulator
VKDIDLSEFLVDDVHCRVLLEIAEKDEPYVSQVADELDISQSRATNIFRYYRENGFISRKVDGRKHIYLLTGDGRKLVDALENLYDVVQEVGENQ